MNHSTTLPPLITMQFDHKTSIIYEGVQNYPNGDKIPVMFPLRLVLAIIRVSLIEPHPVLIVSIARTYFEKNRAIEAIPTITYMQNRLPNKLRLP